MGSRLFGMCDGRNKLGLELNFVFRGQLYDEILIMYGGLHETQRGIWVPTEY